MGASSWATGHAAYGGGCACDLADDHFPWPRARVHRPRPVAPRPSLATDKLIPGGPCQGRYHKGVIMLGYENIQLTKSLTMDEFEAALRQGWRDEWGPYFRGKTNPLMVGEYMIFPLSSAFCVIAHPKEDTIRLSAAPLEQGYVRLLAGALASGKVDPTAQYGAIKSQGKANKMTPLVRDKVAQALQPLIA